MNKVNPSNEMLLAMYKALDEDEFTFSVEYMGPQPNERTFSTQALDELLTQMRMFIGARVLRRWEATKEPPQRVGFRLAIIWEDDEEDEADGN